MILKLIKEKLEIKKFKPKFQKLETELENNIIEGNEYLIFLMQELSGLSLNTKKYYCKIVWEKLSYRARQSFRDELEEDIEEKPNLYLAVVEFLHLVE